MTFSQNDAEFKNISLTNRSEHSKKISLETKENEVEASSQKYFFKIIFRIVTKLAVDYPLPSFKTGKIHF